MDDNLIELYRQLAKLEAQVEYKDSLITYMTAVISALASVIVFLGYMIKNRSEKDSDAIRDRLK